MKVYSIFLITVTCFSMSGCFLCCGEQTNVSKALEPKEEQLLAGRENLFGNRTGMIYSFGEEAPAKDFSFFCNIPDIELNPPGIRSTRTYITGGPNVNFKSAGDDVYANGSHKPGVAFQLGFRTVCRFNETWSLTPGLLFKQNKASEEATINDGEPGGGDPCYSIRDRYSYSYISAPVLAQYNINERLSVMAGPELNYLLKSKVKSSTNYAGEQHESEENLTDNSVKFGVGVQVGLKYEFPDSRWGIELLYDHRLSRLNENPDDYYETPAWRMKSVQLGITCKICNLAGGRKNQTTN